MGKNSGIAWTDHTYNAWIGCTKVSVACDGCYAEAYDNRWGGGHWGPGAPRRRTSLSTRNQPMRWNVAAYKAGKPAKVFCSSLSDFFDNEVPDEWRDEVYALWRTTPWLRWIVLTKRPGNIQKMLPDDWSASKYPNVGFMCSVVTQDELERDAPKLISVPAAWHGLSIEPQVERVVIPWKCNRSIQWIITGGASRQVGYDPPPYDVDWARSLVHECAQAGIACFVKQLGSNPVDVHRLVHRAGADPSEWPESLRVQRFPQELLR